MVLLPEDLQIADAHQRERQDPARRDLPGEEMPFAEAGELLFVGRAGVNSVDKVVIRRAHVLLPA